MPQPRVGVIQIFPIKGFDPVRVDEAVVLPSGALKFDRQWALVDAQGKFINAKNRAAIHTVHVSYDLTVEEVLIDGRARSLPHDGLEIERVMSEIFGEPVTLQCDGSAGFPDDTWASGPTFVGRSSLEVVAGWFDRPLDEIRRRFRTNVEFEDAPAFWEDHFYGHTFGVGDVTVLATNACQRCVVPSRDSQTGEVLNGFQKRFSKLREAHLPETVDPSFFTRRYRFAVNTMIGATEASKIIRVGAPVMYPWSIEADAALLERVRARVVERKPETIDTAS
jgi:uncharacterized protein